MGRNLFLERKALLKEIMPGDKFKYGKHQIIL
jgi:hypothetical protein